jgi:tetratricopeptide (TPR) repeat protein
MILLFVVCFTLLSTPCHAASLEKADMLWNHGLKNQAKIEYIDIVYSNATDNVKAEGLYKLGAVAFEDKNIAAALNTWKQLVKKYPKSRQALIVLDRLKELSEIAGELSRSSVENAVAESYLRHAEFWSREKDRIFHIDSSWIPNVEAAVKWYDKVITEFQKSIASRYAYEGKMRVIIGWKGTGRYEESYGIQGNYEKYMPELINTFTSFEKEHSDAPTLQAFRYQIAQEYWKHRDWDNTKNG